MTSLKPTEYKYLISPFWSDGGDLLETTLQELCLSKVLILEERWVYVDSRDTHQRPRFYFIKSKSFSEYNTDLKAEKFVLAAFENDQELSFAEFRNYVAFHIKDKTEKFKDEYVYPDLETRELCTMKYFLTSSGRKEENDLKIQLKNINKDIDTLLEQPELLKTKLYDIGLNVILLDKEVINKIEKIEPEFANVSLLKHFAENSSFDSLKILTSSSVFGTGTSYSGGASFGGLGGGGGSFSSSGFSGFSGGSFGGGGASGSW